VAALAGVAVFILAVATPSEGLVGFLLRGCVVMVGTGLVSASLELWHRRRARSASGCHL